VERVTSTRRRADACRGRVAAGGLRCLCAAVLVGVVATGCGGSKKASSTASSFKSGPTTAFTGDPNKACAVATKSDVEAAIGTMVKPGQGASGVLCRYEVANAASQFVLVETKESSQSSQIYDLQLSSAAGAESLNGVGEKAFVAGNKAVVLRGSTLTVVTVSTGQPQPAVTAALKKLAQAVGRR
jgi:hypothetical protein